MLAFDSDVLIYAVDPANPSYEQIRSALMDARPAIGSVLLYPEVMTKPARENDTATVMDLARLLVRIELLPTSFATAERATALAAKYKLRAADAVHLATAVDAGADQFITNNRKDFPKSIQEIDITYPDEL